MTIACGFLSFIFEKLLQILLRPNRYSYDIWGKPVQTVSQSFAYSGEYQDKTTGLQYLQARWYAPRIGRFMSEDTYEGNITNPLSLNLYTYVSNNPLRYWDPTGHQLDEKGASVAGFGGYAGSSSDKRLISALLALLFPFYSPAPAQEPTIIPQENPMGNDPYISQQGTEFENGAYVIPQNRSIENQPNIFITPVLKQGIEVQTNSFIDGQLFETSFQSKAGILMRSVSEVEISGSTLRLKDVAIYPEGFSNVEAKNLVGSREIVSWKNQVIELAKSQDFTELIITGMRAEKSSSSNPGKLIDLRIDLTK